MSDIEVASSVGQDEVGQVGRHVVQDVGRRLARLFRQAR